MRRRIRTPSIQEVIVVTAITISAIRVWIDPKVSIEQE
jgi:hypothetical protein